MRVTSGEENNGTLSLGVGDDDDDAANSWVEFDKEEASAWLELGDVKGDSRVELDNDLANELLGLRQS